MYAVLGVSGNTGRVVAERLIAVGAPVRVVVRDAAKGKEWEGKAEAAVADLSDTPALTAAFRGVSAAYVLLPPNPASTGFIDEQARKAQSIADAARAAGVKHLVLLSSVAAHFPSGTGPIVTVRHAEALFAKAVPNTTAVRAAYFLENWAGSFGGIADGIFPTFLRPDVAVDMVATSDIGRTAADALLSGPAGHEVIELATGHAPITPREIAATVSRIVGRDLNVVHAPLDAVVPTFTSFGMSADVAGLFREMLSAFNTTERDPWERSGRFIRTATPVEPVLRKLLGR